jgi:hypothetical protein
MLRIEFGAEVSKFWKQGFAAGSVDSMLIDNKMQP